MSISGFFTGIANVLTGGVVDKVVGVVDKLVVDKDLREKLNAEFRATQFVTDAALEQARIESETAIIQAQEVTHQAEVNQSDIYTKQTRPKIARLSFYFASLYTLGSMASKLHAGVPDIDMEPEAFLLLASPALTYVGVRSIDIWRRGGAKNV
jgi:hypothetical protein